jgi:hypothetical protein
MARSIKDIEKSLASSIKEKDRTVDTTTGPIYDCLIAPVPKELSISEQEANMLAQLHSPQYASVASNDQVNALRVSMRLAEGLGEQAKGTQMFYCNVMPNNGVKIPIGSLIATKDNSLVYRTLTEVSVSDLAEGYYNSTNYRYEFVVDIQAIASGSDYNIPEGRVPTLVTDLEGIDGTINITELSGGSEKESNADTVNRIQKSFLGFDRGTINGLATAYISCIFNSSNDCSEKRAFFSVPKLKARKILF